MICPTCKKNSISIFNIIIKRYINTLCPNCNAVISVKKNNIVSFIPKLVVISLWFIAGYVFNIGEMGQIYVYGLLFMGVILGFLLEVILNLLFGKIIAN